MRILAGYLGVLTLVNLSSAPAQERFEVLAWVDHFDFAGVKLDGAYVFDTETPQGCADILQHVSETGATTMLWRNCGGATMRYQSKADSHHQDAPFDKRRLPDNRGVHGWLRLGEAEPDILKHVFSVCRRQGWGPGVHWPYEENHWGSWTLGGWNLDHPQYWCRNSAGQPWAGRASIAYPPVVEHKLALLDELIERGMETLFVDTWRSGGWSPADEYVPPIVAAWRETHAGADPPRDPRDPAWCRHVSTYVTGLFALMRERLTASGRDIRLLVGAFGMTGTGETPLRERGLDWPTLVSRNILDGIVINSVPWEAKDPFETTRAYYRKVLDKVAGRCDVYCPVRAYDYSGSGMPSYAKATGLSQAEIAEKLIRIAWEEGASGISLECVDYNNYTPATRQAMRGILSSECSRRR